MDKIKLVIDKDELTIDEEDTNLANQLLRGVRGKVRINTPFVRREITKIKDSKGKVLKDDKHPENIGKVEKPKK